MSALRLLAAVGLILVLTGCASLSGGGSGTGAPRPLKPIDAERFYSGRWLEVARLPMDLTDGCVAGATAYVLRGDGKVNVRDTCRVDTPQGRERAISGVGTFVDPGANAKLRVRYLWLIVWEVHFLGSGVRQAVHLHPRSADPGPTGRLGPKSRSIGL